jgi:aminocarboxymuconate-semialdehyde decarboxylase
MLLRELVEEVGSDHVLLGSDYPFDMADPHPVETVRRSGLKDEDAAAVLSGNAEQLLAAGVR